MTRRRRRVGVERSDDGSAVLAAGTALWRRVPSDGSDDAGIEVAVLHRPRHDDWSLPKGKVDPGEHVTTAAVRETAEETGELVVLDRPLPTARYDVPGPDDEPVPKVVRYWAARADANGPSLTLAPAPRPFEPGDEVDELSWLSPGKAAELLSYAHDRAVLAALLAGPLDTSPLVVLRHAKAVKRGSWDGDDEARPLEALGEEQALALVPVLQAFGVTRVVSSPSVRCAATVAPYCATVGVELKVDPRLSEPAFARKPGKTIKAVGRLAGEPDRLAICTHRPVLPSAFRRLVRPDGLTMPKPLKPGELVVLHRQLADGQVRRTVAIERHEVLPAE